MKKASLFVLSCVVAATINSQNIVKEHYTVSGGLLGSFDWTQFRIPEGAGNTVKYHFAGGWSAGAWINLPIAKVFSIEPQVLYSHNGYRIHHTSVTSPLLMNDGQINSFSVPVFLKFHLSDKFALTGGPQMTFITTVEDKSASAAQKSDFDKNYFSVFGGFEIFPHSRVSVFARYVHGLSSLDERTGETPPGIIYKHQAIQAGLKLKLFGKKVEADSDGDGVIDKKDKCPGEIGFARYDGCPIPDRDKDGINDEEDKCPDQAGTAKYLGCPIPDSDKDGINDEQDKCPNEAGIAKYGGCPIPDTDKDGINDEEDKCPTVAGTAKYQGCPIPDSDKDGINDEEDKCPDVPGTAKNNGCPDVPQVNPEVTKALGSAGQSVYFASNSSKLNANSNASLNKVAKILKANPDVKIKIGGHVDNMEKDADMKLSEARAAAAKAFLVSKGISEDRITTEAIGSTMPISENNNAAGRTKNRRVEIKVAY